MFRMGGREEGGLKQLSMKGIESKERCVPAKLVFFHLFYYISTLHTVKKKHSNLICRAINENSFPFLLYPVRFFCFFLSQKNS